MNGTCSSSVYQSQELSTVSHCYPVQIEEQPIKRLGYREKQELEQLDGKIEAATAHKEAVESQIEHCSQIGDFEKVFRLTEDLSTVSDSIDTMTDRWMELAERAEIAGTV